MGWKTFVAQIIDTLAWPAVVLIVIYQLRDKIAELLPRLKKFKHKETEIEFAEGVTELVQEREATGDTEVELPRSDEFRDQFDFLLRLANISPRSAVIESFRILEAAAAKKAARLYPHGEGRSVRSPIQLHRVLKGHVFDSQQYHQFNQLRKLRNEAAHTEDFDVRGMPVESYIDIALSLAARLEGGDP